MVAIAGSVLEYLDRSGVDYSIVHHPFAPSSMRTAEAADVSGELIAKGVLLKDPEGYVLVVVPATHHIRIGHLQDWLGRVVETAPEGDLTVVFPDCALGAVPALGAAYQLGTVVDESLRDLPQVYFEAGDHEELICVTGSDFEALMDDAVFLSCSMHSA